MLEGEKASKHITYNKSKWYNVLAMLVIFPMAGLSSFCNPLHKDPGHLLCDINSPLPSCKLEQWIIKWLGVPQGQGWCVIPEVWSVEEAAIHLFESALRRFPPGFCSVCSKQTLFGFNCTEQSVIHTHLPSQNSSPSQQGNWESLTGQESDQHSACSGTSKNLWSVQFTIKVTLLSLIQVL